MVEGFNDRHQAVDAIQESVKIYNGERPHLSCGMLTPVQAHQQNKMIVKKWKQKPRKPKALGVKITNFNA
jgi:putative transposase